MNSVDNVLVFTLSGRRYALHLAAVERIFRAVEINPVPKAPDTVLGIINVRGEIVPVLNIRRFFRLPDREQDPDDRLIILQTKERLVAFPADDVAGVLECRDCGAAGKAVLPEVEFLEGVMALDDGIILIYDLDRFLSTREVSSIIRHSAPESGPGPAAGEEGEAHD